jgi:hypothetical protein
MPQRQGPDEQELQTGGVGGPSTRSRRAVGHRGVEGSPARLVSLRGRGHARPSIARGG